MWANLRTLAFTRKPGAAWSAVRLTPSSSFNPGGGALEAYGRIRAGRPPARARIGRRRVDYGDGRIQRIFGREETLVPISIGA